MTNFREPVTSYTSLFSDDLSHLMTVRQQSFWTVRVGEMLFIVLGLNNTVYEGEETSPSSDLAQFAQLEITPSLSCVGGGGKLDHVLTP